MSWLGGDALVAVDQPRVPQPLFLGLQVGPVVVVELAGNEQADRRRGALPAQEQEGIDLARSRRFSDWHSPVTVSMSVDRDRSMVSHGHPSPLPASELIGTPPRSRDRCDSLATAGSP